MVVVLECSFNGVGHKPNILGSEKYYTLQLRYNYRLHTSFRNYRRSS